MHRTMCSLSWTQVMKWAKMPSLKERSGRVCPSAPYTGGGTGKYSIPEAIAQLPPWRSRQRVSLIIWRSWVRASQVAHFFTLFLSFLPFLTVFFTTFPHSPHPFIQLFPVSPHFPPFPYYCVYLSPSAIPCSLAFGLTWAMICSYSSAGKRLGTSPEFNMLLMSSRNSSTTIWK